MIRALAFLFAAPLLAGCSDGMVAAYCDARLPDAYLEVSTEMDEVLVRHSLSRVEISNRLARAGKADMHGSAVGMTTAEMVQDVDYNIIGVRGLGFVCARPQVKVILSVKHPVVDVASDLRPNGCLHGAVLQHEQRHVDAYSEHLEEVVAQLRTEFAQRYPRGSFLRAKTPTEMTRAQNAELKDWMAPLLSQALDRVDERQAAIDTREEYERLALHCSQ